MPASLSRGLLSVALSFLPIACGGPASHALDGDGASDASASPSDAPCVSDAAPAPGIVVTDRGAVQGRALAASYAYLGVPYAAPPVGALRWRSPQPPACWSDVRDATGYGYQCMQYDRYGNPVGSEDCLTLNVWTPSATPASPLPVLVFMHGGYNNEGSSGLISGGEYVYDGQYVAEHGPAVVVTLNYRLGVMGWLAHPAFAGEDPDHATAGNYGTLDQIAALRWVQRNVGAFGGDPARVMLFGQSAGGADACVLLASPRANGLFARAMMMSGGCAALTTATTQQAAATLAQQLGCAASDDVAACLRGRSAPEVLTALPPSYNGQGGLFYDPVVDGDVLREPPLAALQAGRYAHMPLIIGTTSNEFSTLISGFISAPVTTDDAYHAALDAIFGAALGDVVFERYPSADYGSPMQALITALSDLWNTCPARLAARAAAGSQHEPVRRYLFTHTFEEGPLVAYGAGHTFDLLFALHKLAYGGTVPSADELALSDAMVGYWTRFAATGDPQGAGAPAWPAYDPATDDYLALDTTITTGAGIRTAMCDYWDRWSP